jgi:hypothetical protein
MGWARCSRCTVAFGMLLPLAAVANQAAPSGALPVPAGLVTCAEPTTIKFKPGSARLDERAKTELDAVVSSSKPRPLATVRWRAGKTPGSEDAHAALEQRRMDAIRKYLADRGIDPTSVVSSPEIGGARGPAAHAVELVSCAPRPTTAEAATPPSQAEPAPTPVVSPPKQNGLAPKSGEPGPTPGR